MLLASGVMVRVLGTDEASSSASSSRADSSAALERRIEEVAGSSRDAVAALVKSVEKAGLTETSPVQFTV